MQLVDKSRHVELSIFDSFPFTIVRIKIYFREVTIEKHLKTLGINSNHGQHRTNLNYISVGLILTWRDLCRGLSEVWCAGEAVAEPLLLQLLQAVVLLATEAVPAASVQVWSLTQFYSVNLFKIKDWCSKVWFYYQHTIRFQGHLCSSGSNAHGDIESRVGTNRPSTVWN